MEAKAEILEAIQGVKKDLTKKIDDNQTEFKRVMFGQDGSGGLMKEVINIKSEVFGLEGVQDSRGLVGTVKDHERVMHGGNGRPGCQQRLSTVEIATGKVEKRQAWWNRGLSVTVIGAWVKSFFI
ncbi:MAG: hypothetical protein SWO11_21520 [Thermodesulfobacteriota bacterium]|nr:hypothetical protein [Thermodesulfobacteriota bacterium]